VVVDDPSDFVARWDGLRATIGPVVYQKHLGFAPIINHIDPDWLRYDVSVITPDQLSRHSRSGLRPLHDPDSRYEKLPRRTEPQSPDPARIGDMATEFLRVLGLLPVVLARNELVCAASGATLLRDLLIRLMVEDTTVEDRGGALHLSRLLSPDRLAVLAALPPIEATRDSAVAAHLACARAFLPLARHLAGPHYPTTLESTCRTHLTTTLALPLE